MSLSPSGTSAFRHRDFRLVQVARLLAVIGTQMQSVAIGWQVYDATRRPIDLGYVGLAQFVPGVGLALFTGHVADRFDRRRILLVYYATMAICSAALWALAAGPTAVRPIYAVLFVIGAARAFAGPASQALLPHLVPLQDFPNAVAWNASTWQLGSIVGPAVGGLAYGAATIGNLFAHNVSLWMLLGCTQIG